MPKINVLLFSVIRQVVGEDQLSVTFDGDYTGADLLNDLIDSHQAISEFKPVIRLAVNLEYRDEEVMLKDGDEVALITPVSGG